MIVETLSITLKNSQAQKCIQKLRVNKIFLHVMKKKNTFMKLESVTKKVFVQDICDTNLLHSKAHKLLVNMMHN